MITARGCALQVCQVLVTLGLAPLLQGIILQYEERVQRAQGPGIFQPYRDLWKLFHKQIVVPESVSWLYWATPIVAFTAMLTVPILIPVLTNYPLPLSSMGDILGGGLILTLASFMITLENGIFLGAQILVPGMPLLIEIVLLFDLLIVVACFGLLVQYLLTHVGSTSSLALRRLVG